VVTNNGSASALFSAQAASTSPSLFVASGGQYVVSTPSFAGVLGLPENLDKQHPRPDYSGDVGKEECAYHHVQAIGISEN
jgi:hypothetical protein